MQSGLYLLCNKSRVCEEGSGALSGPEEEGRSLGTGQADRPGKDPECQRLSQSQSNCCRESVLLLPRFLIALSTQQEHWPGSCYAQGFAVIGFKWH